MKLECPVVRDLYVLYKENELSREVRDAVMEHLESCSWCKNIYESEKDFGDILKHDTEDQPSKKMDENRKIAESYNKINQLALIYSEYNKFPYEISPMTQDELKKRIKHVLDMEDLDIKFHQNVFDAGIRLNGGSDFDGTSKENNLHIYGTIDAYTGKLQRLQVNSRKEAGELLPLEKIKDNLQTFLNREYGDDIDFNIEYLGINHNFHSNTDIKLYSFQVYPVYKGYKVNIPLIVYFDSRTGFIHSTMINASYDFIIPEYTVDTSINVKPETGLKSLEEQIKDLKEYAYLETSIIKSKLSGKYVLVLVYENEHRKVYVNCSTGVQEYSF